MRNSLTLTGDLTDTIATMSEGNPGGLSVLIQAVKKKGDPVASIAFLLHMEDMNIRGSQIWVGYKDHCGQDIDSFIEKIENRDEVMVKAINDEITRYDEAAEVAVCLGGTN